MGCQKLTLWSVPSCFNKFLRVYKSQGQRNLGNAFSKRLSKLFGTMLKNVTKRNDYTIEAREAANSWNVLIK